MLLEFLTRLPVISTVSPPKLGSHSMSQPTDSSSIGPYKPAPIQFSRFLDLEDAIGLAHLHEQRLALEKGSGRPSLGTGRPLLPTLKLQPLAQVSPSPPSSTQNFATPSSDAKVPFHRLSSSEAAQRRHKTFVTIVTRNTLGITSANRNRNCCCSRTTDKVLQFLNLPWTLRWPKTCN
ncbi:hypothetical protein GOBAR_AA02111 [Gossypium barbadense]|uniref:Uncharacterized protein n=1 Tax=Gossypium barbadense TaxID=3634 RepID=A0A2P5YS97_GOSBA|nr:hypothetical protein GOBAR_AA02111 [Gossypium barbadense]